MVATQIQASTILRSVLPFSLFKENPPTLNFQMRQSQQTGLCIFTQIYHFPMRRTIRLSVLVAVLLRQYQNPQQKNVYSIMMAKYVNSPVA